MTRRRWRCLLLPILLPFGTADAAPPEVDAPSRPNIVFIVADDHRADHLGCVGRPGIETAAIDALAARGVRFDRAYCQGSTSPAVCLPSRARMISGRSDWTTTIVRSTASSI